MYELKEARFSPSKSKNNNIIIVTRILSPLGPLLAGSDNNGLCFLEFIFPNGLEDLTLKIKNYFKTEVVPGENEVLKKTETQLTEYFNKKRTLFNIPLSLKGTNFQLKAWEELLKIPYGQTISYHEQAAAIGNPKAVRAVANANGDNKITIIVPCHRVIGKNGTLTGYGGGLWRKDFLINMEKG